MEPFHPLKDCMEEHGIIMDHDDDDEEEEGVESKD